jgi:hypothetical protein
LKNASRKRAGGVAQGVGPEFKPQYHKKKKLSLRSTHNSHKICIITPTFTDKKTEAVHINEIKLK